MDSGFQHCLLCLLPLSIGSRLEALLLHGEACSVERPASQSNQRAELWAMGGGMSALAVSGQTRIHWESSARGALHIVLGCTSFMLPQNLKSRVAAVVRRCCGDPQQGARRALGEEMD